MISVGFELWILKAPGLTLVDNWDPTANPMTRDSFGVWDVTVPAKDGAVAIPHDSKIKVSPNCL